MPTQMLLKKHDLLQFSDVTIGVRCVTCLHVLFYVLHFGTMFSREWSVLYEVLVVL